MTANIRFLVFHDHPHITFISITAIASFLALRPAPSPLAIVFTLTTLLLYIRILVPARHAFQYAIYLFLAMTVGGSLSELSAATHALSTPGVSLLVLFAMSGITSFLTLIAVYADTKVHSHLSSPWAQITFFPALWATLWFCISKVSPIGRLSAWSAPEALGVYDWTTQFVGFLGADWFVAAWAVVLFQAIGAWFIGFEDDEPLITHIDNSTTEQSSSSAPMSLGSSNLLLAALLMALALPSFIVSDLPVAAISADTTPLSVGCVLPPIQRYKHDLTLNDYIAESQKLTSSAKILLWPEGAVAFKSEGEKYEAFDRIRKVVTGSYIAISYEETIGNSDRKSTRYSKRTGLAIISSKSSSPHLEYYKRHLVPSKHLLRTHITAPTLPHNLKLQSHFRCRIPPNLQASLLLI